MQIVGRKQTFIKRTKQQSIQLNAAISSRRGAFDSICVRKLSSINMNVLDRLLEDRTRPAREIMVRVIYTSLKRPSVNIEHVSLWSDRTLNRIGALWLRPLMGNRMALITSETFRDILSNYVRIEGNSTHSRIIGFAARYTPDYSTRISAPNAELLSAKQREKFSGLSVRLTPPAQIFPAGLSSLTSSWKSPFAEALTGLEKYNNHPANLWSDVARARSITESFEKSVRINEQQAAFHKRISDAVAATSGTQAMLERITKSMTVDPGLHASIESMRKSMTFATTTFESLIPSQVLNYPYFDPTASLSRLAKLVDNWEELRRQREEYRLGMNALESSGFAFMSLLFSDEFIRTFGRLPAQTRHAVLTRRLHTFTCHPGFTSRISQASACHPMLMRRWKVVSRGLLAHQERDYIASIAILLPQVEGIFTDLMVERHEATIWLGKPHAKAGGKLKLNTKSKPVRFNGLNMKINHCDPQDDPMLQNIIEQFLNQLLDERNSILHGNRPNYGSSKGSTMLSTRIVWAIYGLCYLLAAMQLLPTDIDAAQGPGELIYINRL